MILLASCVELPEPDPDESLLVEALRRRGVEARVAAWDDASVDWGAARACVIRSTWNYHHRRDDFVAWANRVGEVTRLFNPPRIVAWNSDKSYLRDLERAGIAIAPTAWIDRGERDERDERGDASSLRSIMGARGWDDVVVKPRVSAASFGTTRVRRDEIDRGERHLEDLLRARDAMVQRYVRSVEGRGERSLVWIDGAFTHSVRKSPRFSDGSEQVSPALPIDGDDRAFAGRVLRHVGTSDLLYARVDVARDDEGAPLVMELELVEPSLFLAQSPAALDRFVSAIAVRCDRP